MKYKQLKFKSDFSVVLGNRRSQAAEMVLQTGDKEGDPANRHRGSDQWLYVVSGKGKAIVNRKSYKLSAGALLLIERGDLHEVRSTGKEPLRTLNFYVPPAYDKKGDELPRGRR
jgi:mannose-6-phosphate isomerase-like protein (cupin superfamily)